jgi:1-acyl-sn-glycerol-3-phosphate acyltransferase
MYMAIVALLRFFVKYVLFWKISIKSTGKENIPKKGPVVIVFNHTDYLDPVFIMISVKRNLWALTASNYSKNPIIIIFKILGRAILVDRDRVDDKAIDKAFNVLKDGKFLGVSPEGTRSKDGILRKGKFGPAYLAGITNSQILPIGIVGSVGATKKLLRGKIEVSVNIGKPFRLINIEGLVGDTEEANNNGGIKDIMTTLREWRDVTNNQIVPKIAELLPDNQRGEFT